ncbi:FAD-dependent oxidoreductase [Sorangium sp. So ce542]|uniref:FAD-dependent oxidoreductase n=1 Tax=Sorangium sp. So ce542 TaxID=3133316 RepID=UPI003F5DC630
MHQPENNDDRGEMMNEGGPAVNSAARGEEARRDPPEARPLPRVWVFGAGIAGLTVAHELAERGFDVHVVEPAEDPWRPGECDVGGVARTQWAQIDEGDMPSLSSGKMTRADTLCPTIRWEPGMVKSNERSVRRLIDTISTYDEIPTLQLIGHGHTAQDGETNAKKFEEHLRGKLPQRTLSFKVSGKENPREAGRIDVNVELTRLPGEHGFRFFPSFYQHVFDTMSRIPVVTSTQDFSETFRTVLDNLVPTNSSYLAMAARGDKPARTVVFPREAPTGLSPLLSTLKDYVSELGYTHGDIAQLALKIFKYMTSCTERREAEYEDISWWDFIEGDRLSPTCQDHMDKAPEVLGAMVARKSDARTQGNCVTQLLLDPILRPGRVDATLISPTSSAWFEHWRKYLRDAQEVKFHIGRLSGFRYDEVSKQILPVISGDGAGQLTADCYFVIAASLPVMLRSDPGTEGGAPDEPGLAQRFLGVHKQHVHDLPAEVQDFEKLAAWAEELKDKDWNDPNHMQDNPLQHLTGIQFFFTTDVMARGGHTLYLDSPWRLSSISQPRFWHRRRDTSDPYRGLLSVDIGNVYTEGGQAKGAKSGQLQGKTMWESTRAEIAEEVWSQVVATLAPDVRAPKPIYYHIDDYLEFDPKTDTPIRNGAPYLVNRPSDWRRRPGTPGAYQVQCGRWVLAGTYMQTYTRLTTMEAANESGRHAANAILDDLQRRDSSLSFPRCETWNPEEGELPDLEWLKQLDRGLFYYPGSGDDEPAHGPASEGRSGGLPHFVDILGLDELPEALLRAIAEGTEKGATLSSIMSTIASSLGLPTRS